MTIEVLRSRAQIESARKELGKRKASFARGGPAPLARRLPWRAVRGIGDRLKSWDVWRTLRFVEATCPRQAQVMDLGAYESELPYVLGAVGYTRIVALDLTRELAEMPRRRGIDPVRGDFLRLPLRDHSVRAVTAVSVIEHGYRGAMLFEEVSRVLIPGGHFISSFDYWPEKLDTTGINLFGMDWRIFSREEVGELLLEASASGLVPMGGANLQAGEPVARHAGRDYTFAWMVLRNDGRASIR